VLRNVTAVIRTSAVWISTGDKPKFYSSLHDVPEGLRQQLVECTNSANSGTILIADRGGRERLIAGAQAATAPRASAKQKKYARIPQFGRVSPRRPQAAEVEAQLSAPEPAPETAVAPELNTHWLAWAGLALVLGSAAVIATAFGLHW
jgi:hypothetical protein